MLRPRRSRLAVVPFALLNVPLLLAACGHTAVVPAQIPVTPTSPAVGSGPVTGSGATARGCPTGLPTVTGFQLTAPVTTLAPPPGTPPPPFARYVFADAALRSLPSTGDAYCFDPSAADARLDALRALLKPSGQVTLTVSIGDDRAWQFRRPMPLDDAPSALMPLCPTTTVPGSKPCGRTAPAVRVADREAKRIAIAVMEAAGVDLAAGSFWVRSEGSDWDARFTPAVSGDALATQVQLAPDGTVVAARGHLGEPVLAGAYPLVDAATGLTRVNAPLDQLAASTGRGRFDVVMEDVAVVLRLALTPLVGVPQGCSSEFLTLVGTGF